MPTSDPEFYDAPKFSPEPYESPRERGCFFYGCIIASVLAVLFLVAMGVLLYVLYRAVGQLVDEYTATVPRELPKVEMPAEKRQTLKERVEAFRKAIDTGTPIEPLVLTGDEINALLEENPVLHGKIFVAIEGEKVKAQVSIPLESIGVPMLGGRYLNGEAELKASLSEGVLIVTLESFEVNGKHPPSQFLDSLRTQNLAKDAYKDPKNAEQIRKLESIAIKDGKIIIKARVKRADTAPGATDAPKDLPENVLAPPNSDRPEAEPSKAEPPKGEEPLRKP
jgi:hypothetical protein